MTIILCFFMLTVGAACEDPRQTQTQAFEKAETHYRTGEYDAALDGYQAFLEAYPTSPLAETAELRIRSIHREVRSVLMRKDMPRPRYLGGKDTTANEQLNSKQPASQGPDANSTIRQETIRQETNRQETNR